jgi:hypothetical protein
MRPRGLLEASHDLTCRIDAVSNRKKTSQSAVGDIEDSETSIRVVHKPAESPIRRMRVPWNRKAGFPNNLPCVVDAIGVGGEGDGDINSGEETLSGIMIYNRGHETLDKSRTPDRR